MSFSLVTTVYFVCVLVQHEQGVHSVEWITGALVYELLAAEKIWDLPCSRSVVLHFSEPLWSEASPTELLHSSALGCTCVLRTACGNISGESLHSSKSVIYLFCKIQSASYASY